MTDQPNLLFIWTDQQAVDTLGTYGNEVVDTPNLDRLARRGIAFDNAYITQPICTASRSSILSGLYPHTTGLTENNVTLPSNLSCLPELGSFGAYETGFHGKWHLGDEIFPQHGFDDWKGIEDQYRDYYSRCEGRGVHSAYHRYLVDEGYDPDVTDPDGFERFSRAFCARLPERDGKAAYLARQATQFIRRNRDSPFVLSVMFLEPHWPFFGPRDDEYDPRDVALPASFDDDLTDKPLKYRLMQEAVAEGRGPLGDDITDNRPPTEDDWRELVSNYWGLVSLVDDQVGRILETLEDCGLEEDTIVVFTSDHGDMMGSHGLTGKRTMFEESIKVPLLLRLPADDKAGRRVERPVSLVDLVPTLLDLMGSPVPDHLHGNSWTPWLCEGREVPATPVFVEWNGPSTGFGTTDRRPDILDCWRAMATPDEIEAACTDPIRTVVTPDGWKLNYSQRGEHELYDLTTDPHELENLADDPRYEDRIEDLRSDIRAWQRQTRDPIYL